MISRRVFFAAALAAAAPMQRLHAAAASPNATVAAFYDALLATMKVGPTVGFSGRRERLAPAIRRAFDLPLMTRLMVGPQWTSLTPDQQTAARRRLQRVQHRHLCQPVRRLFGRALRDRSRLDADQQWHHRPYQAGQDRQRSRGARLPHARGRWRLADHRRLSERHRQRARDTALGVLLRPAARRRRCAGRRCYRRKPRSCAAEPLFLGCLRCLRCIRPGRRVCRILVERIELGDRRRLAVPEHGGTVLAVKAAQLGIEIDGVALQFVERIEIARALVDAVDPGTRPGSRYR